MASLIRFEPVVAPEELHPYIDALRQEHREEPFSFSDFRGTAKRVGQLASSMGLSPKLYRGYVTSLGGELDRVWCAIDSDQTSGALVIDPSLPLNDKEFGPIFKSYAALESSNEDVEQFVLNAAFSSRVICEFPKEASYLGEPLIFGHSKFN